MKTTTLYGARRARLISLRFPRPIGAVFVALVLAAMPSSACSSDPSPSSPSADAGSDQTTDSTASVVDAAPDTSVPALGEGDVESESGARAQGSVLAYNPVRVDAAGRLLPWARWPGAYAHVSKIAFERFVTFPVQPNGLPPYYIASTFLPDKNFSSGDWPQHPAGMGAMLVDSALLHYAYTGDRRALDAVRAYMDHVLSNGLSKSTDDWAGVPYSSANYGDLTYEGADVERYCGGTACGIGDGRGFLEPDKVGEAGFAFAQLYELTGDTKYLDAAQRCADALVSHARPGDGLRSIWPFRVDAKTGKDVVVEYSSNIIGAIHLFDELVALGRGDAAAYVMHRDRALAWAFAFPYKTGHWDGYFEDIHNQLPGQNPTQYGPLELARYLMANEAVDPDWKAHSEALIGYAKRVFGRDVVGPLNVFELGNQWGAEVISEQETDLAKMGSHTSK